MVLRASPVALLLRVLCTNLLYLCLAQTGLPDDEQCGQLEGECNSCICCCYKPGLGLMKYKPDENSCECKTDLAPGFGMAMVLLGTTTLVTLISGCYFSGKLPVSPFKAPEELPPTVEMVPTRSQA